MANPTTTTAKPTTTTTPAPKPAAQAAIVAAPQSVIRVAAPDPKKARLLPAGPWLRAGAAEGLSPQEAQKLRAAIEPDGQSILLWAKALPHEGVDIDGVRSAWGGLPDLSDAHVRAVMRVISEYAGIEYIPGKDQ